MKKILVHQIGFSLVELMLAMTLSMFLIAGVFTLYNSQNRTADEIEKMARQIENGRYSVSVLADDLQQAGFYDQYVGAFPLPAALPDPCALDVSSVSEALAFPIQPYASPASVPTALSACLPDSDHVPNTDILVIRRTNVDDVAISSPSVIGQLYMQTTPTAFVVGLGPDATPFTLVQKDNATSAPLRNYVEHIYYISPCNMLAPGETHCSAHSDKGQPVPTLKRLELTVSDNAPYLKAVSLAEGIEDMRFDFSVESDVSGVPLDTYTRTLGLADLPNLMMARINLLARSIKKSTDYTDAKSYTLGLSGSTAAKNDAYRRHVFSVAVRLNNLGGRKE